MPFRHFNPKVKDHPALDEAVIFKACELADQVHKKQKRKSGEPFVVHPIAVAEIILEMGGDETMICAALLHDAIEESADPQSMTKTIQKEFGPGVHFLIESLSKDDRIQDKIEQQAAYFKQITEALKLDTSVFFLKMADLIHNMQTIDGLPPDRREKWITELKEVYLPLLSEQFHTVSFHYHDMYLNLINRLESVIHEYDRMS